MSIDMSPRAVTERLRWVSKKRSERYFSSQAVTRRLRKVEQLRRLCQKLGQLKPKRSPE